MKKKSKKIIRVAINGMGRIGRIILKKLLVLPDYQIVAINDLMTVANLSYLLKYDSALGKWEEKISYQANRLIFNQNKIIYSQVAKREKLGWEKLAIDLVIDSTGKINSQVEGESYLQKGVKKVLVTSFVPALKNVIFGVNDQLLHKEDKILATASCTTIALSLVLAILLKKYQIKSVFFNTIHSVTGDQRVVDQSYQTNWAKGRSVFNNIIPNKSLASQGTEVVLPELKNKIFGLAVRVPVVTGSLLDVVITTKETNQKEAIEQLLQTEKASNILLTKEKLVSSDIIGSSYGAIIPLELIKVTKNQIRIMIWYDNESSYVSQIIKILSSYVQL